MSKSFLWLFFNYGVYNSPKIHLWELGRHTPMTFHAFFVNASVLHVPFVEYSLLRFQVRFKPINTEG